MNNKLIMSDLNSIYILEIPKKIIVGSGIIPSNATELNTFIQILSELDNRNSKFPSLCKLELGNEIKSRLLFNKENQEYNQEELKEVLAKKVKEQDLVYELCLKLRSSSNTDAFFQRTNRII